MGTLVLAAEVVGLLIFGYASIGIVQAIRETEGTVYEALVLLFLTQIAYLFVTGATNLFIHWQVPLESQLWYPVPFLVILSGLLWGASATDWQTLIRHATIAGEVEEKIGGDR